MSNDHIFIQEIEREKRKNGKDIGTQTESQLLTSSTKTPHPKIPEPSGSSENQTKL